MSSDIDPIDLANPSREQVPFIPIDPFLGHHQHWSGIRRTLTNSIRRAIQTVQDTSTSETLERYLGLSSGSVRPLLLETSDRLATTRLLAEFTQSLEQSPSVPLSVTFIRHQARINRLSHILRKTGIELSASMDRRDPPPSTNDEIFSWFRSVLNRLPLGGVIIWDAIDLAVDSRTGHPWFWLTSPFPPSVRLILSSGPGEFAETCKSRGIETVLCSTPSSDRENITSSSAWQDEIVELLCASRGGRTEEELTSILSAPDESEVSDAVAALGPMIERDDQGQFFVSVAKFEADRSAHEKIADWLRTQPRQSDGWLWEYPWQLMKLDRWEELADLLSHPSMMWRWWSHYRADVVEAAKELTSNQTASFGEIADRAQQRDEFRLHHALAYAAILVSLGDYSAALQLLQSITEASTAVDSRLHLQLARRRAIEYARDMNDIELAWNLLQTLEKEIPSSTDFRTRGQWNLLKVDLLIRRDERSAAMACLQSLEDESQREGHTWFEAEALRVQAEIAILDANDAALSTIDTKLLAHARLHGWDHCHLAPLRREIQRKVSMEDWPSARSLSLNLQDISARLADIDALGESLGTLAVLENREGHYPEMITLLAAKERLCREAGDMAGVVDLLLSRAVAVGFRLGDKKGAKSLVDEALRWSVELNDTDRESKAKQFLERLSAAP